MQNSYQQFWHSDDNLFQNLNWSKCDVLALQRDRIAQQGRRENDARDWLMLNDIALARSKPWCSVLFFKKKSFNFFLTGIVILLHVLN